MNIIAVRPVVLGTPWRDFARASEITMSGIAVIEMAEHPPGDAFFLFAENWHPRKDATRRGPVHGSAAEAENG